MPGNPEEYAASSSSFGIVCRKPASTPGISSAAAVTMTLFRKNTPAFLPTKACLYLNG
ncbi:MAG: hypothetical protein ACOYWZ_18560 [Bacillota bacterium]